MIQIGSTVLVEQCWEDESGFYHDEYARVKSIDPLILSWDVSEPKVRAFLDGCEFTIDDLQEVSEPSTK